MPETWAVRLSTDSIQAFVPSSVLAVSTMQNAHRMNSGRSIWRIIVPADTLAWTRSVAGKYWPMLSRPYRASGIQTSPYFTCHDGTFLTNSARPSLAGSIV